MVTGTDDLGARTEALVGAAELAEGRVDPIVVADAHRVVEQLRGRLTHGTDHTVVALAGPTGSGKSSLFNGIVGEQISRVGVTRPTTGRTQAAVFGPDAGVDGLLGWLDVRDRHLVADAPPGLSGLVLLDLPDFDSTNVEHRIEVDRLVELVDLLVWVVEPQKYADDVFHADYLRPLSEHAAVQRFVLTKTDLLTPAQTEAVLPDLRRRLTEDGIADPTVWTASTVPAGGSDEVRAGLEKAVRARTAVVQRLDADLRSAAAPLGAGSATEPTVVGTRDRARLTDDLAGAAGVALVAEGVAHDHRQDARRATGWPVVRWLKRRRPAHLTGRRVVDGPDPIVDVAAVEASLRSVAEAVGEPLGPPWSQALRRETRMRRDEVASALGGQVLAAARETSRPPRWWRAVALLQNLALLVAAVGLGWLVLLIVLGSFQLDTEALVPEVGIFPLPTLLLGGGILAGWLISLVARVPARAGARRRGRRAARRMDEVVDQVAGDDVIAGIEAVLAERAELARLAGIAAGS